MGFNKIFIDKLVYPYMEKHKANKIRQYIRELKHSDKLSSQQIYKLQRGKLKKLLLHCIDNVPAYEEFKDLRGVINKDPYEGLRQISVLTKEKFLIDHDRYISKTVDKNTLIHNNTGGSTGEPVKFYLDRYTVEHYEAARWRSLSWWGIEPSDPSVMIWGSPIELSKASDIKYKLKERFLKNRIILPAYDIDSKKMNEYVDKINKFKPKYIYGYASALYAFSKILMDKNIYVNIPLKGVLSTAETLHDYQRKAIERAFNCPVINEYGARDGGIIAYQCPKGHMHISAENLVLEIVDIQTKEPVEMGKRGLVLVTDLNNFAMPRLRYQLGDMAIISNKETQCKINLPILESIEGREDEMFISKDGKMVHGHYWNHIARNMSSIKQFQFIQHSKEKATLKVVKSSKFKQKDIDNFVEEIENVLGVEEVNVKYLKDIPTSNSGKIRYAIREFDID